MIARKSERYVSLKGGRGVWSVEHGMGDEEVEATVEEEKRSLEVESLWKRPSSGEEGGVPSLSSSHHT